MNNRNYVKVYGKSEDDFLYFSEPFSKWQAWIDLLGMALPCDRVVVVRGRRLQGRRGGVYKSRRDLADRWMWSRGRASRFIDYLINADKVVEELVEIAPGRLVSCLRVLYLEDLREDASAQGGPAEALPEPYGDDPLEAAPRTATANQMRTTPWEGQTHYGTDSCAWGETGGRTNFGPLCEPLQKEKEQEKENLSPIPPIKEKEKEKEKDLPPSPRVRAHEGERAETTGEAAAAPVTWEGESYVPADGALVSVDRIEAAYYREMCGDVATLERTCMNLHIAPPRYRELLAEFAAECGAKCIVHGGGLADYRRHAYDWMRRHLEIDREKQQRQNRTSPNPKQQSNGNNGNGHSGLTAKQQFLDGYEQQQREEYRRMGIDYDAVKAGTGASPFDPLPDEGAAG